jgi:site-specific DNA recombinase
MTRAVIYCRISRDRIGAGLGVERQEADCRALALRLGFLVVLVLVDNDISAYSGKPRPAYKRLLDLIARGEVDAVLAWHTDRLHRSPAELEEYIKVCKAHDVPTHTATAGELDLATASGQMVARIVGAVARHEVDHQVERQQAAKLQAAVAGKWAGGRRPFGFDADGITVRPDEARVVAESTDAILNGASLRATAAGLNDKGVLTSTGKPWAAGELKKVLVRARNAGLREHRGAVVGPAEWPAIVPEEKWRAVVSMLADPGRRNTFTTVRRWLLSNIAVCAVCGDNLRVTLAGTSSTRSYTCTARKHVVRIASELEDYISAVVIERLSRPDAIDLLQPARPEVDVRALQAEAAALRRRLDDLADDLDIDERTLARRTQKLKERQAEVEQEMADAGRGSVFEGVVGAEDVAKRWRGLHLDRRRAIVDTLMWIVVYRTKKGRPKGWKPGESYFDPKGVKILWK